MEGSSPLLSCFFDNLSDPVQLFIGHRTTLGSQERGHHLFPGPVEERMDEMLQCRLPHRMAWNPWRVDILLALFLVPDVTLLLEDAELRSNGGVGRLAGQFREDLGDCDAAKPVDDVHDLALAPGQARVKSV